MPLLLAPSVGETIQWAQDTGCGGRRDLANASPLPALGQSEGAWQPFLGQHFYSQRHARLTVGTCQGIPLAT